MDFRNLITRALDWPVVWRYAVRLALRHEHDDTRSKCLPCAAHDRRLKDAHSPTINIRGRVVCAKCDEWFPFHSSRCKGSRPQNPTLNQPRRLPVFPAFWE